MDKLTEFKEFIKKKKVEADDAYNETSKQRYALKSEALNGVIIEIEKFQSDDCE